PIHLRAIVESGQPFPAASLVISATAPLSQSLACAVETRLRAPLLEMFGSTETCVIATRRTALEQAWHAYEGISLTPQGEMTIVEEPWFAEAVMLQDAIESDGTAQLTVRSRYSDMLEDGWKFASLGDLTQRVLAI